MRSTKYFQNRREKQKHEVHSIHAERISIIILPYANKGKIICLMYLKKVFKGLEQSKRHFHIKVLIFNYNKNYFVQFNVS